MKESKFSEHQIAFILKQDGDDTSLGEDCRKAHRSRAVPAGARNSPAFSPPELWRLKQLEEKNSRLKRMVAKRVTLDISRLGKPTDNVVGQAPGTVEDGERAVGIFLDPNPGLDEVRPEGAWRDLQREGVVADGVVIADNRSSWRQRMSWT